MGVGSQPHVSASFPPGERDPLPILQEAGWVSEPVSTVWKIFPYWDSIRVPSRPSEWPFPLDSLGLRGRVYVGSQILTDW
jgi:hypothetical protein